MTERVPGRPVAALAMPADLPGRLLSPTARARLTAAVEVDLGCCVDDLTAGWAQELLGRVEVLVTGWGAPRVDHAVLQRLPRLRAIVHTAGSVKGLLAPQVWEAGIVVAAAAGANAVPVAEFTLAAVLMSGKAVPGLSREFTRRRGTVVPAPHHATIGNYGRSVGVVGASRIGRRVLALLAAHDLELLLHDPWVDPREAHDLGARACGLDELMATSDVVTLHAPLLDSTRHLVDGDRLALMRDGATLVNTARGGLVEPVALERELLSGRLNAFLDVTVPEPLPPDSLLWTSPNVVLTPHLAGSAGNEELRLGDHAVDEVLRYAAGRPFLEPVLLADLGRIA